MDLTAIQTFVGSFGFPVFMCCIMAKYISSTHKELVDAMYQLNRTMMAILTKLDMEDDEKNES
ncbi:MAG: hypothetical protein J6S85_00100 [Methanobrevibacter sp.]|nr:hypothetical protein [Methanobrevibacter sp.]